MSVVILYRGQRKTFKCGPAPMKSTVSIIKSMHLYCLSNVFLLILYVSVSPPPCHRTYMQVDEAIQHFRINPTLQCDLMHKNKKVDISTPFRLSSIPNNALLELVCSDNKKKGGSSGTSTTRLALSCDSGFGNLSGNFGYVYIYIKENLSFSRWV